jgi:hypothetical protein
MADLGVPQGGIRVVFSVMVRKACSRTPSPGSPGTWFATTSGHAEEPAANYSGRRGTEIGDLWFSLR